MHCFSFDIETVPDVEFGRRFWDLEGLPDDEVATAMIFMRQQSAGTDFLPLHQQRIVAISVSFRTADTFKLHPAREIAIQPVGQCRGYEHNDTGNI